MVGTAWNNGAEIVTPAFDMDGNPAAFSDAERARIQAIWERVSEDFRPFEVDVTTEDPGVEALRNTGGPDTEWGVRVIIGGDGAWSGGQYGGIAFVGSFTWDSDTPCFVFTINLGNDEKNVAEAISHEAGHTVGLGHDGRTNPVEEYYAGHGTGDTGWAPIMGVGYSRNLTQWSRGEYANANNNQDDLAIITTQNGFSYRADDHGNNTATADPLTVSSPTSVFGAGIIERSTDLDFFRFSLTGTGTVVLNVNPFYRGPNLDILARLYNSAGAVIATSNPTAALNASFNLTLSSGTYYLSIDGTANGDPLGNGYTDYASLGYFSINATVSGTTFSVNAPAAVVSSSTPALSARSPDPGHATLSSAVGTEPLTEIVLERGRQPSSVRLSELAIALRQGEWTQVALGRMEGIHRDLILADESNRVRVQSREAMAGQEPSLGVNPSVDVLPVLNNRPRLGLAATGLSGKHRPTALSAAIDLVMAACVADVLELG